MVENRTFAEILHEKLGQPQTKKVEKSKNPPLKTDFFRSETPIFGPTFSWKPKGKSYVIRKKTPSKPPVREEIKAEPPPPNVTIDLFNRSEKTALEQIQSLGGLAGCQSLTEMQLKKTYRTLVKRYHPDKETGSAEAFLKLQEAYNIVLKAFYRVIATCGSESASA